MGTNVIRTYETSKPKRTQTWPYVPNQPQWVEVPFAAARAVNPGALEFTGQRAEADGVHFYFQERGNPAAVVVVK